MENLACPICHSKDIKFLLQQRVQKSDFVVNLCSACGLGFLASSGSADKSLYDETFYARGGLNAFIERITRLLTRLKVARLRKLATHGAVLDIGAGDGRFLAQFPPANYQRYALETSRTGFTFCQKWGFTGCYNEPLETAPLKDNSIDLVIMNHVLEHIENVHEVLDKIQRILRPGGIFVSAQPNLQSWDFAIAGSQFFHLDLPRHVFHFTPTALRVLLEAHGLQILRLTFPWWEFPQVLTYSIMSRYLPNTNPAARRLLGLVFLPLTIPIAVLASYFRRTNTMEAVAQKTTDFVFEQR